MKFKSLILLALITVLSTPLQPIESFLPESEPYLVLEIHNDLDLSYNP